MLVDSIPIEPTLAGFKDMNKVVFDLIPGICGRTNVLRFGRRRRGRGSEMDENNHFSAQLSRAPTAEKPHYNLL